MLATIFLQRVTREWKKYLSALMQHYQDWSCLPPASATKQDWRPLRTLLVKYQTSSRRGAERRDCQGGENKTNIYFILMLLYYCCFFYPSLMSPTLLQSFITSPNPTISGTTSQINIKLTVLHNTSLLQTRKKVPNIWTHRSAHTDTSQSYARPTLAHIFLQ